jgi:hypothetical protein
LGWQNGVQVFGASFENINEYNELRTVLFTPTKAHSQYMPALGAIPQSLELYGLPPTLAIFTDLPRGDRAKLEEMFPSLWANVVPIPDQSSHETLTYPSEWQSTILSSPFQIETHLRSIMEDVTEGEELYVGMDMEWPVD